MLRHPLSKFKQWHEAYLAQNISKDTPMCLSTCLNNQPSSRMVLLKEVRDQGFVFFTNYDSRKAKELSENNKCALLFSWGDRQVRVEGVANRLSFEESQRYFKSRPLESQIASLASKQSQVLESRDDYLKRIEEFKTKDLSCEGVWGGFSVESFRFEFWTAGEHRMHDREVYELNADDQSWRTYHLYP